MSIIYDHEGVAFCKCMRKEIGGHLGVSLYCTGTEWLNVPLIIFCREPNSK